MNEEHRALYDAISGIDPVFIEESSKPHRKQNHLLRFVAAAAILALLLTLPGLFSREEKYVTAPGMLAIRAYAVSSTEGPDMDGAIMEEGIEFPREYAWSEATNVASGIPIFLSITDENLIDANITWEIRIHDGLFRKSDDGHFHSEGIAVDDYLGQHFTVPNNTMLLWSNTFFDPEIYSAQSGTAVDPNAFISYYGESTFVEAIIRADNHIIGYCVIRICGLPNPLEEFNDGSIVCFIPKLVAANYYPMVNGEFQEITEEYITQQIKAAKSL